LRARELHQTVRYQRALERIEARARGDLPPYLLRQVADVQVLDEDAGPILKLGWTMKNNQAEADERAFDRWVQPLTGRDVSFVYALPGRTLSPKRPKASPYVATERGVRVLVQPGESAVDKLERAKTQLPQHFYNGVKKHFGRLFREARSFHPMPYRAASPIESLQGLLEATTR